MRDEKDMRRDNLNEEEWYQKGKNSFQEFKFEQAEYYELIIEEVE